MPRVHIVGGRQRPDAGQREAWHAHQLALIAEADFHSRDVRVRVEYTSPPELCPDLDPSICFAAATVEDDRLYACTKTEVLIYQWPDLVQLRHLSLPCFHDIHHVRPAPGGVYIANTGLDMVLHCSFEGEIIRLWNVMGSPDPWSRFSPDVDYRKVLTTKPHESHPNYVFVLDGNPWVTRFHQRDAVELGGSGRISIGLERCHDGILVGDHLWFTCVDGHLARVDVRTREVDRTWDLSRIAGDLRRPGWCRGVAILPGHRALVGFTRMRPTKWADNVGWLRGGIKALKALANRPARIALFDLESERLEWELPLDGVDVSTVFSLHIVEP